jgi:hypothetical protein
LVTFIEYPRIVYYKHFGGRVIFPMRGDYLLAHKLQLALLKIGGPQASQTSSQPLSLWMEMKFF